MALNSIGTSGAAEINHVALCKSEERPCGIGESRRETLGQVLIKENPSL